MKAKTYKFPCDCLDKGDVKLLEMKTMKKYKLQNKEKNKI